MSMPERKRRAERYEELPPEPVNESTPPQSAASGVEPLLPLPHDVVATNTGVRLACTMAAMIGLFALFLCWAEKESRVIRRFSVQSAALFIVHMAVIAVLVAVGFVCNAVPYFGFLMTTMCWLVYIAMVILLLAMRVKLMESAWHGRRCDIPLLERAIQRYY